MKRKSFLAVTLSLAIAAGLSACALEVVEPTPTASSSNSSPSAGAAPESTKPAEVGGQLTTGDCAGKDITLNQDDTTSILSGTCASVTISGTGIYATIENADSITVTGSGNTLIVGTEATTVTLDAGSDGNFVSGSSIGDVIVAGTNSNVVVSTIGTMTVTGSNNFLTWNEGATSASDTGSGNTVVPASGN